MLPTTKRRRSRITSRQAAALEQGSTRLLRVSDGEWEIDASAVADVLEHLNPESGWVLDMGFGTGEPVALAAQADPEICIIAVDLHTPGIGDLVSRVEAENLMNVVVIEADVRSVLPALPPASLLGARTFFPDPWPKKRHHRRRLVTEQFVQDLATRVQPGGFWHLATDWSDYSDHIVEFIGASTCWRGGVIARPPHRPITRYERHALADGRNVTDLWFERIPL